MEDFVIEGSKTSAATEYFCKDCKQLRLNLTDKKSQCGKCGSKNIVVGAVGSLDKTKLLAQGEK